MILCFTYFKPDIYIDEILELLQLSLTHVLEKYSDQIILVLGDFNSRVGEVSSISELHVQNTNVYENMLNSDKVVNYRGRCLVEFMMSHNFSLINGSIITDRPANFTFSGPQGNSVIDLVFCNNLHLPIINSLTVLNLVSMSDHFPVLLNINFDNKINDQASIPSNFKQLRWKESASSEYKQTMRTSRNVGKFSNINENYLNIVNSITHAANTLGMVHKYVGLTRTKNKPWFDADCLAAKRNLKSTLKLCRKNNFSQPLATQYSSLKKIYRSTLNRKKKERGQEVIQTISNTRDQTGFWKAINMFRPRPIAFSLSTQNWETYFDQGMTQRIKIDTMFYDARNPYLDYPITFSELKICLDKCKNNKAPGSDGLSYEFLKNLPQNWLLYTCKLFNEILDKETLPSEWYHVIVSMLHKKGPKENPENYRRIALVNCITKLFTSIILDRLSHYCELHNILPEIQCGFRANRGCMDNVFSLNAIIQIHLRLKRRKVYAAFVDFKQAFDTIDHNILYSKLYSLGISSKIIRIIKSLYDEAFMSIRANNAFSKPYEISEGVLQGESLSPLLFSLFIADIEQFFLDRGHQGLNIDNVNNLLLLLYADDLVILSDSQSDLNKKLRTLAEYANSNKLTVNTTKTKVMIFSKGGFHSNYNCSNLYYNNEKLVVTKQFSYLGVLFSSSSLFLEMSTTTITRIKQAFGAVNSIIYQSKMTSWDARLKLYNSVIVAMLSYCVSLWGLRYEEVLERVQVSFFKQLLTLLRNTPDYIVRMETSVIKLSYSVFKSALSWLANLIAMDNARIPKLCYLRLLELSDNCDSRYNWVAQVKSIFDSLNRTDLWNAYSRGTRNLRAIQREILTLYENKLRSDDLNSLMSSECLWLYNSLHNNTYLRQGLPMYITKIIAQVRTSNKKILKITSRGVTYLINNEYTCTICNLNKPESSEHIFFECPIYHPYRITFLNEISDANSLAVALSTGNPRLLTKIAFYVLNALKLRSFILNE